MKAVRVYQAFDTLTREVIYKLIMPEDSECLSLKVFL